MSKLLERVDHLSHIDVQPTIVVHYIVYKMPLCASYKKITLALVSNNQICIAFRNIENHFPKEFIICLERFVMLIEKKQVSMIRKYHNHTPETNPRRLEVEPQNTDCHKTSGGMFKQSN